MADREGGRKLGTGILLATFACLCAIPYLRWSFHPALYDDDFLRAGSLRRLSLAEALFRPFNEHMAPLFELTSWVAWQAAGRDLLRLPATYLIASMAAFLVTTLLLGLVIRRETGSRAVAMAGIALFSLSTVSAETVLWFSASSFQWAAAATLAAWYAAARSGGAEGAGPALGWLAASILAAACAPAFSAIGVLAGPVAALRVLAGTEPGRSAIVRLALSIVPGLGTALYLLICSRFRYAEVLTGSVRTHLHVWSALRATARAPMSVLVPALVGLPEQAGRIPEPTADLLALGGLVLALVWAARSRDRALIVVGVAMIWAGYLAAFATRARPDDPWIFRVERYHLFPQIGLIGLIAAGFASLGRRVKIRPPVSLAMATGLAVALAIVQDPRIRVAADLRYRDPDQPRTLAATLRLERVCEREGITLVQAMKKLDPIGFRSFPRSTEFNPLLYLFGPGPVSPLISEAQVRSTVIAALSPEDREVIFGGMDASLHTRPFSSGPPGPIEATPNSSRGVEPLRDGRVRVRGGSDYLEYRVGPDTDSARALQVPGLAMGDEVEVWWAGESEGWSAFRSVRWRGGIREDFAVPLDQLPHWRSGSVRKIRLVFREGGVKKVGPPRFFP